MLELLGKKVLQTRLQTRVAHDFVARDARRGLQPKQAATMPAYPLVRVRLNNFGHTQRSILLRQYKVFLIFHLFILMRLSGFAWDHSAQLPSWFLGTGCPSF